jgi:hypothetical protein
MATMIVTFRVDDFDRWRKVFDAMESARLAHDIVAASVHRDADDPAVVVTILTARSLAAARAWGGSDLLRHAMADAGVAAPPVVAFLEDVPQTGPLSPPWSSPAP